MSKVTSKSKSGKPAAGKPAAGKPAAVVKGKGKGKPAAVVKPAGVKKQNVNSVPVETKLASNGMFASVRIFGHPLAQVLRTLGKKEFTSSECRGIMDEIGLQAVRINTIRDKVGEGRNGEEVKLAPLSQKEVAKLRALVPAAG